MKATQNLVSHSLPSLSLFLNIFIIIIFCIIYVRSIDHNFLGFQVKLVFQINLLPTNNMINSTHSESNAINMPRKPKE